MVFRAKKLKSSLTLGNGEVIPLGFRRRAHETAIDISENTKEEFRELQEINGKEDFLPHTLEKRGYFMNNHASN
jgi:hypothetical protein